MTAKDIFNNEDLAHDSTEDNTYTIKLIVNNVNRKPVIDPAQSLILSTTWIAN